MSENLLAAVKTEMPTESLAERLRALRVAANLEPYQLAERSGVSRATISKIESGEQQTVRLDTATKLARALGCDVKDLWGTPRPSVRESAPSTYAVDPRRYEIADVPRMLREYLASEWYAEDAPTPEEMKWLATLTGIMFPRGAPKPGAIELHDLLMMRRAGKL